ncbi:MAG: HEPN domain-containing protein [Deltaproteobacteria bacterium]|nr:HEPN domain-containing protein [Deltaproteobacteria bacterium]
MKPGILPLINKAKDSLGAARVLLRDGYYDFAASRAYYSMFYIAEAMLMQIDKSYSKHSAVISAFGQEYAKAGVMDSKFHRWLIDAQDFRNIGDYGIETHISEDDAKSTCEWAGEFIKKAEEILHHRGG